MSIDTRLAIECHHDLLLGTFFSKLEHHPDHIRVHTNVLDEWCWDYVLPLSNEYCAPNTANIYTHPSLKTTHHELVLHDSWMVHRLNQQPLPCPTKNTSYQFKEVSTEQEMALFLEGFLQSYSGFYPEDPYGKLSNAYYPALLSAFTTKSTKLKYFYVLNDSNQCLGTVALGVSNSFCFAYCVGITPSFRKMGLGKLLLDFQKTYAQSQECDFLIVQTEKDSFVQRFYTNNGFEEFTKMGFYERLV